MAQERQASPIENRILDAIYDIRSRGVEELGKMTLLLGPDEWAELVGGEERELSSEFFGFLILLVPTPGIAFAWPPSAADKVREEMRK